MRAPVLLLSLCAAGLGQSPEAARVEQHGSDVRVVADSARPLDAISIALADRFGISISVEDPIWLYPGDLRDAAMENPRLRKGVLVPRGGLLDFGFTVGAGGSIEDVQAVMQSLLDAVNRELSLRYRLDVEKDRFTFVPIRIRDASGVMTDVVPLLDRHVTIPYATRTVAQAAVLMAEDLSKQTGLRVGCCQAFVAGIPWGMKEIEFGVENRPAREVLKHLIQSEGDRHRWLLRCDLHFCFINLQ